jgi:hypothetical protein
VVVRTSLAFGHEYFGQGDPRVDSAGELLIAQVLRGVRRCGMVERLPNLAGDVARLT